MRKFVKKKYTQKGPSPRIKNPVRPIKKTVTNKSGKTTERTYYKLIDKNKKDKINNTKKKKKISISINKNDFKKVKNNDKSNKELINNFKNKHEIINEKNMKDEDWLFLAKHEKKIKEHIDNLYKETGNKYEMILGLNEKMESYFEKKGKETEIELTDDEIDYLRKNKITLHNHPTEVPFSMEDLWIYTKLGHNKGLVSFKNNNLLYVNLEDNKNTYPEYKRMWNDSLWYAREKMDKLVDKGVYDINTQMDLINREYNKIAFDVMSEKYGLRYTHLKLRS